MPMNPFFVVNVKVIFKSNDWERMWFDVSVF